MLAAVDCSGKAVTAQKLGLASSSAFIWPVLSLIAMQTSLRLCTLVAVVLALIGSIAWCAAGWSRPQQFIFLPYGDVGVGFRSHAGQLEWGEYADWERRFYSYWSTPWTVVLGLEMIAVAAAAWWWQERKTNQRPPPQQYL